MAGVDARLAAAFEVLAESPDGVARMREFVLSLAVRGELVTQDPHDGPAAATLKLLRRSDWEDEEGLAVEGRPALPPGWMWARLKDVAAINPRVTAQDDATVGFVPMACVPTDYRSPVQFERRTWGSIKSGYTHMADGDVAVAKITPCFQNAKSCILAGLPGGVGAGTTELVVFRVDAELVVDKFLLVFFKSPEFLLAGVATMTGTAGQQRVASDYLRNGLVPIPPVAEQRRIVARVDELMAWIDQFEAARNQREAARIAARDACLATLCAATNPTEVAAAWSTLAARFDSLFTASADVEPLRLAIIHLAVRGALVGRSSQGESGDACPDHALGWPFAGAGGVLPPGWCWARLGEVADARLGKMLDKAKNRGVSRPYLRNTNVHWFRFELGSIKQIPLGDGEFEDLRLTSGDVLICEGGHGIGRSAVWMGQIDGVVFQKALHRVRPTDRLDSWFLTFCLRVLEATGVLASYYTGAGIPHFTGKALDRLLIALPPCDEQRRIVERARELLMVCDHLEVALVSTDASAQAVSETLVSCEDRA